MIIRSCNAPSFGLLKNVLILAEEFSVVKPKDFFWLLRNAQKALNAFFLGRFQRSDQGQIVLLGVQDLARHAADVAGRDLLELRDDFFDRADAITRHQALPDP